MRGKKAKILRKLSHKYAIARGVKTSELKMNKETGQILWTGFRGIAKLFKKTYKENHGWRKSYL